MFHSPTGCRSVTSVLKARVASVTPRSISPYKTILCISLFLHHFRVRLFVCLLGSGKYRLIFNIKLNKIKYITLVGAPRAPKKEPNAGIGEIVSPIASATYPASHSLSFFLFTSPNFLYISNKKSFIFLIPLLSLLTSSLALLYFFE